MAKHYAEDLVYTETEEGIILAGLAIQPAVKPVKPTAVVWIPGLSIHFYHPSFIPIGRELAGLGYAFVIGNHRGHDIGANLWRKTADGQGMTRTHGGALWERFEESPRDVAAWIDFTMHLGYQDVALVGHSFGGPKVLYYQAQRQDPRLMGLILASATTEFAPQDPELVAQAEQMVADGCGEDLLPWGSTEAWVVRTLSAQTYLSWHRMPDLYGTHTPQPAIAQIRCPLLACYGTNEGFDPTADFELIRRNAIAARSIDTRLFEGANHGYDNHERDVAEAIGHWIDARR
jgi:pimeloyl-ACP methyl ester carboxylesterase